MTGANGRVGGRVVELLAERGHEVVGLVRRAPAEVQKTATYRQADYRDPTRLRESIAGMETLVFVSGDGEAASLLVAHRNIVEAIDHCGVKHVVVLSGLDADLGSPFCYGVTNGATEQMLHATGAMVSVVRSSIFAEFFGQWPRAALATGRLELPAEDARISLVAREDVAALLADLADAELSSSGKYLATGPAALDMHEVASIAARDLGRSLVYRPVTPSAFAQSQALDGVDPWWTYAYTGMFASVRQGRWAQVSQTIPERLGRPALDFAL